MRKGYAVITLLMMMLNVSAVYAGEPTYTYFYCNYNAKNGATLFSRYSNLFFEANGGGRSGAMMASYKIKAIFENTEPMKMPSGLFVSVKPRVECGSWSETETSLKYSIAQTAYNLRNKKEGVDYIIVNGIDKRNDYLKSKNYKKYLISPLFKYKRTKLERMSAAEILSLTKSVN